MEGRPSFDEVFRAHGRDVARWAARLAGPEGDADDVFQDVFLLVHRKLPGLSWRAGDGTLRTWLYRATERLAAKRRRKERWRQLFRLRVEDEARLEAPLPGPAEALEARRRSETLYRVLDGLDEKYRSVLILFELEGLPGEEIAALLGIAPATVWVRLHRARALFLDRLARLRRSGRVDVGPAEGAT